MARHAQLIEQLNSTLLHLCTHAAEQAKAGQNNAATSAERWVNLVLRETLGLKKLNVVDVGLAAIDLADEQARVSVQVSLEIDLTKVLSTITMFVEKELYRKFDRLIFFFLKTKQKSYTRDRLLAATNGKLEFDPARDILDRADVIKLARALEIEKLETLVENIQGHLPVLAPRNSRLRLAAVDQQKKKKHFLRFDVDGRVDLIKMFCAPDFYNQVYLYGVPNQPMPGSDPVATCIRTLEGNHLALIVGPFGIGKTVLSKLVLIQFAKSRIEECDTYFFKAIDLANLGFSWEESFPADVNTLVVIDGLDELFDLNDMKALDNFLRSCAVFLSQIQRNKYLIINSRIVSQEGGDDFITRLATPLYEQLQVSEINVLGLVPFTKPQIQHWLDCYWNNVVMAGAHTKLDYSTLSGLRGIAQAAAIPLFLLVYARSYYSPGFSQFNDIYGIYEVFVNSTMLGKFNLESLDGSASVQSLEIPYVELLQRLAIAIYCSNYIQLPDKEMPSWELDPNTTIYDIQVSKMPPEVFQGLGGNSPRQTNKEKLFVAITLSNYFLAFGGKKWRFRDNNLLFYFVAKYWLGFLERLCELHLNVNMSDDLRQTEQDRLLRELGTCALHPTAIHLLLHKLDSLERSHDIKRHLFAALANLILTNKVMGVDKDTKHFMSRERINTDILLALVFLHVNASSHDALEIPFLLKRFEIVLNAAARIVPGIEDVARVFFQKIHLIGAKLAGINYRGYNFSHSTVESSEFNRCNLEGTVFTGATFKHVTFYLCDLKDMVFKMPNESSIRFRNCVLSDVEFETTHDLNVVFEKCFLQLVKIKSNGKDRPAITGRVNESTIDKLKFEKVYLNSFALDNCLTSAPISADHVEGELVCKADRRNELPRVNDSTGKLKVKNGS